MTPVVQAWFELHGWPVFITLVLWLFTNFAVNQFGRQLIALVLKEQTVVKKRRTKISLHDQQRIATRSSLFSKIARASIFVIFTTMLLNELGLPVVPLLAGAGLVGVTVGFGAQSVIKDVLAGLFVVAENQYVKGDRVKLDEVTGIVEDLSLRVTVLRGDDGVVHYVPYGSVEVISNYSQDSSSEL